MAYKIFSTYEEALTNILDKKEKEGIVSRTCDLTRIITYSGNKEPYTNTLDKFEKNLILHFLNDEEKLKSIIQCKLFFYANEAFNIATSLLTKEEYLERLNRHYGYKKNRADTVYRFCRDIIRNSKYLKEEIKKCIEYKEQKKTINDRGQTVKINPFTRFRKGRCFTYRHD